MPALGNLSFKSWRAEIKAVRSEAWTEKQLAEYSPSGPCSLIS